MSETTVPNACIKLLTLDVVPHATNKMAVYLESTWYVTVFHNRVGKIEFLNSDLF